MVNFEFASAARVLFGPGSLKQACETIRSWEGRIILVRGRSRSRLDPLLSQLPAPEAEVEITGEPSIEAVERALSPLRGIDAPVVVAMGGGGVIDAGKAIAGLLTNDGEPLDYLEVIGRGKQIMKAAAPFAAIPTTAGTGSEVTRNAVLTSTAQKVKVSLRSPLLLPALACVDPELTLTMPPDLTANTGMDALAQVFEPFVSIAANPVTDALCREGLLRARSLRKAFLNGSDLAARTDMALTSLLGGLALANAKLGAVHGFAAPIGGMFEAPHGAVCAALLAPAITENLRALRARAPESNLLNRYAEAARILTGRDDADPEDAADWVRELRKDLKIAPLSAYGIRESDFAEICAKAAKASSMKGNSIELGPEELRSILETAF